MRIRDIVRFITLVVFVWLTGYGDLASFQVATSAGADPQAPAPPDAVSRDADGRPVVPAVKLTEPFKLDGRLEEEFYQKVPPTTGFFQTVPDPGKPATQATDVWVSFDASHVYVSARCWDSAGERGWPLRSCFSAARLD